MMSKKIIGILLLALFAYSANAQHTVSGTVTDEKNGEFMPFVTVTYNGLQKGTNTDIDGKFTLLSDIPITKISFSFIGYKPKEITSSEIDFSKPITIKLSPVSYSLGEFVVKPGENPAHRIIKKAAENRKINNPESISFKYETYNKFIFTAAIDSFLLNNPDTINSLDTSDQKTIEFFNKQHLFMMESVTERKFIPPDNTYEKVLASRVSGFKNPSFTALATQFQSFSFYNDPMVINYTTYLNPIGNGSTEKYLFLIQDTLYQNETDSVFVISFRPLKGKNFKGLQGILFINTNGYAIQNVIAEAYEQSEVSNIKITQKYEQINNQWFPTQLNTLLSFPNTMVNNHSLVGIGRSYIKNIEINPELKKREFGNIAVDLNKEAYKKDDLFWNEHRIDSLSEKEKTTYQVIDSISEAENLELKLKFFEAATNGYIPVGPINLDLNRLLDANAYEGFRLGMGITTNFEISEKWRLSGYGAYGFKDKAFKYGGDFEWKINKRKGLGFKTWYQVDVKETGSITFFEKKQWLSTETTRNFLVNRMDSVEEVGALFYFRTLKHFSINIFGLQSTYNATNNYQFAKRLSPEITSLRNDFTFLEAGIQVRFAFKEKYLLTQDGSVSLGTKYPIVYFKYSQNIPYEIGNDFEFQKIDLRLDKTFYIKNLGKSSFRLAAGKVIGDVPLQKLVAHPAAFQNGFITSEYSFETMRLQEFYSDEYFHGFFRHSFGSLLLKTKDFEPEFVMVYSTAWGKMKDIQNHRNYSFNTLEKGYHEAGLEIHHLFTMGFSSFGIASYYRFGPYQLSNSKDNFTYKFSFRIKFD